MIGAIGLADLLAHPVITIRCFGWKVFFRSLVSSREDTFLSLLRDSRIFETARPHLPEMIEQCVTLEHQAMRIYKLLAQRFAYCDQARRFFEDLARQEQSHAELLEIGWSVAKPSLDDEHFRPLLEYTANMFHEMQQIVTTINTVGSLEEAVDLVIKIESSEVNSVFCQVMRDFDSEFIKRLRPFRQAVENHLDFICRNVEELTPAKNGDCRSTLGSVSKNVKAVRERSDLAAPMTVSV